MTYKEALDYIASLAPRGWRLGLDRMQEFVRRAELTDALGAPGGPQFIHVAGTNGKGSVTAYLQSLLVESGYRTGSFFSPYVYSPRERVQFNRDLIDPQALADLTEHLRPIGESLSETEFGGVTEFEFKTALGFLYWKLTRCQWVALETGLGGRLDATNVVTPKCSVIVSIGLDHTSILGDTLAQIAFEKAGIIKQRVPVVVGQMSDAPLKVIHEVASLHNSEVWQYGREIKVSGGVEPGTCTIETPRAQHVGLRVGLPGAGQGHNLALAVAAMDAAGATRTLKGLVRGSSRASIPGRFQRTRYKGVQFLLDGAHNRDAAIVLKAGLEQMLGNWSADVKAKPRVVLLTNMVQGHDPAEFYETIAPLVATAHVAPIDFHRTQPPTEIAVVLNGMGVQALGHTNAQQALDCALKDAGEGGLVLVTGSFYLVGEIGRLIGLGEADDPD